MLHDGASIGRFTWPPDKYGKFAQGYLLPLLKKGVPKYITNARASLMILSVDALPIPITCSDSNYDDTYVCSAYTHYISYLLHEVNRNENSRWRRMENKFALRALGGLLRLAEVNRVVCVNNWFLSTNLYPDLTQSQIERITRYLTTRFPTHAVVFRSINERTAGSLFYLLPQLGYLLVVSRPVYIFPGPSLHQLKKSHRRDIRKDKEILQRSSYELMQPPDFRDEDVPRILELYNFLYIERHSPLNPQFTDEFFSNVVRNRPIELYGLKKAGKIDAIMGYFELGGTMVTPIFGYDTSLPQSVGLYRMISNLALNIALQNQFIDHASAGAASFKRNRGYRPVMEYSAVYAQHLPARRRSVWSLIQRLGERVVIPHIQQHKL